MNKDDREANPESPFFLSLDYKTLVAGIRSNWSDYSVRYDLRTGGVDATNGTTWPHRSSPARER